MDKRTMQFKLLSYKQALRKAQQKDDKDAIRSWSDGIRELKHEIEQAI